MKSSAISFSGFGSIRFTLGCGYDLHQYHDDSASEHHHANPRDGSIIADVINQKYTCRKARNGREPFDQAQATERYLNRTRPWIAFGDTYGL